MYSSHIMLHICSLGFHLFASVFLKFFVKSDSLISILPSIEAVLNEKWLHFWRSFQIIAKLDVNQLNLRIWCFHSGHFLNNSTMDGCSLTPPIVMRCRLQVKRLWFMLVHFVSFCRKNKQFQYYLYECYISTKSLIIYPV